MDLTVAFYLSYAAAWVFLIFHSLIILGLVRTVYSLQRGAVEVAGYPLVGHTAPEFEAVDTTGATFNSSRLRGRPRSLLFVSTTCTSCITTLDELRALRSKVDGGAVLLICRDARSNCSRLAERYEFSGPILVDEHHRISELYGVSSVPTAVLVDRENRVQTYGSPRREDFERLLVSTGDVD